MGVMRRLGVIVWLTTSGCGGAGLVMPGDSGVPDVDARGADMPDAGADGGGGNSCVSVIGSGGEPWQNLQVVGSAFDAYEGRRIRIVVGASVSGRRGVGNVAIANGAFDLTIPATIVFGAYTEIDLYVDDDADDTCDAGEPLWGFVTGIVEDHLLLEVTPDLLCVRNGGPRVGTGCRQWLTPIGPCLINSQTDLALRLPCPP